MTFGVSLAGFAADRFSIQNVFNVVALLLVVLSLGFSLIDKLTGKLND